MFSPSDYDFALPPELIAQEPAAAREASRLLHLAPDGAVTDHAFTELAALLPADAVVIANDTRVIPARVRGHKSSGGGIELLFLEPEPSTPAPAGSAAWRCLARARRPLRPGQRVDIDGAPALEILTERAADGTVAVAAPGDGLAFLDAHGHIPLPRYIHRPDRPADGERYQTMFARHPGAVAAPTAGLHMTPAIAEQLAARGIALATLTLHVGWGTFAPVREADLRDHRMHRERYIIPEATAALVATGRPIVALGTTALRALEAAATGPATVAAGPGATDLFIYPGSGHAFQVVSHLITNFHLPGSTLLMLVCAFAGTDRVLAAYRHAVAARYRFFSYGDATLLHRLPADPARV
ncbi:MAG: tRNA preQ1(34) S-adenosylmethionine ribosyltransferase-isomerase QueA [Deltaproteobacteria bacterium]|nr:MAG: tRNA preQ1(34) S-adenosylmethionine ribosyltransferase-isomerase QueA [Deltaproteobacteria bacterium]